MLGLRDKAAIVGVGCTEYSRNSGVSTLTLALMAIRAAADDAGLSLKDLDGVACHRIGDSVQAAIVAQSLGIEDLRFHYDLWGGGSASAGVVGAAAMAVATGMAETVVCWRALNSRSEFRMGGTGRAAPDTIEFQYQSPYGLATAPQQFAMYTRAYMESRGATAEDLGHVAIAQREYASMNDRAMERTVFSMDEYMASRFVVEPLRLFDCCLETDGAVALIVTTPERARDLAQPSVLIAGAAYGSGQNLYSNGREGLVPTAASSMAERLYSGAGLGAEDVDVACLYDAYTSLVLMQLEDYGFCRPGEAGGFVGSGETRLGGALPVNTHGGHLSEGYVHGLNHVAEAVWQLRGSCGDRQVEGAEVALSTGQPGCVAGSTSAVLLRRAE